MRMKEKLRKGVEGKGGRKTIFYLKLGKNPNIFPLYSCTRSDLFNITTMGTRFYKDVGS